MVKGGVWVISVKSVSSYKMLKILREANISCCLWMFLLMGDQGKYGVKRISDCLERFQTIESSMGLHEHSRRLT